MQEILLLLLAGLGSLSGAFIGARLALVQHRSERAFDRRLEWYENTVGVAGELVQIVRRCDTLELPERHAVVEEAKPLTRRLISSLLQSPIYSDSEETQETLALLADALEEWLAGFEATSDPSLRKVDEQLAETYAHLIEEAREHLYPSRRSFRLLRRN